MANAGTLSVSILARTSRFRRSMRTIRKDLTSFRRRVFSLNAALVSAATGGGLGLFIQRQFESIDTLTKTADKLGLTTESLAGLRHAAKLTGNETRTLDLGIQRMTRRISEAAQGSGEAQGAIRELGLDAKELAGLSVDQQFLRISDAMERVSSQSDRVRLGFKLFDSEGVALINTMRGGSAALRDYFQEAEKLGIAFNRVDARKIELANDAMTRVRAVVTGTGQAVAFELAPKILALSEMFIEASTSGQNMGGKVSMAFERISVWIARAVNLIKIMQLGFRTVQATGLKILSVWTRIVSFIPAVRILGVSEFVTDFAEGFSQAGDKTIDKMKELSAEINDNTIGKQLIDFLDRADEKAKNWPKLSRTPAVRTSRIRASQSPAGPVRLSPRPLISAAWQSEASVVTASRLSGTRSSSAQTSYSNAWSATRVDSSKPLFNACH